MRETRTSTHLRGRPNRFTSEGRGCRLFFTPNQSVQALHEIGEERIVVSNQPRWRRVLKARRSKIPVENRGHGMERLQTVKHGRSPLLQADYSIGHLILKARSAGPEKRLHCCFAVTSRGDPGSSTLLREAVVIYRRRGRGSAVMTEMCWR
jgi:hypothetical protein